MGAQSTHVVIAGVSTRAAAESAARAGYQVTAIDAFGDLDHHERVRVVSVPRETGACYSASAAARLARSVDCAAAMYVSNFENRGRAVRALAAGRALWGNTPGALARARDPFVVARELRARGCVTPAVMTSAEMEPPRSSGGWLSKPRSSGGGHGVRRWPGSMPVARGRYLQALVEGTPGSVVFVAGTRRARVLAVTRQLVGDPAFGAAGYRYCGSILAPAGDAQFADGPRLLRAASMLADAAADAFELVGLNGVDFLASDGVAHAIEINPRWCASMELVERASGLSMFALHAEACRSGTVATTRAAHMPPAQAVGKAIVYARAAVIVGDTRGWLGDSTVRDVPQPGERIGRGRPVCTVFATGVDAAACHAALVGRAERVYRCLHEWQREAA